MPCGSARLTCGRRAAVKQYGLELLRFVAVAGERPFVLGPTRMKK